MTAKTKKLQLPGKPENMRVIDYLRKNFSHEGFEWYYDTVHSVPGWTLKDIVFGYRIAAIYFYNKNIWFYAKSSNEDVVWDTSFRISEPITEHEGKDFERFVSSTIKKIFSKREAKEKKKNKQSSQEQSKTRQVLMNFWTNIKLFWMNIQGHLQ